MPPKGRKKGKRNKREKGTHIATTHHGLAIIYYLIMIILAIFFIYYFIYLKGILDPYLDEMTNNTNGIGTFIRFLVLNSKRYL